MRESEIKIEDIAAYLDRTGLQYMATVGLDDKPKVRPVQYMILSEYMILSGGKLWFCTNSEKAMYAEMQQLPNIELCASKLEAEEMTTTWIRFSAEVVFEENLAVKTAIMKKSAIVHELYGNNPRHPLFKVFYLKNIQGSVNNLGSVKGLPERADFAKPAVFAL
ncbi:pyridoxamine 5'-phosphate oxidase family protein [Treponema pedis]|uniref:Pyridoxamine 5'-phosphate oxidase family protein n=1 Tax=Treponema pedis TaxID=409322 RepID=A0A7S7AWL5_9SPIR|nr:pyridoxamine 5'-phosphate oxidase family protein [Treponema pedis]QOW61042.1 pyridoxamine 5'-phosphate oxidase family protein [Treponema pedis]